MRLTKILILAAVTLTVFAFALIYYFTRNSFGTNFVDQSFANYDCPENSKNTPYPQSYQGHLIDTHVHIPAIPDGPPPAFSLPGTLKPMMGITSSISKFVCMLEQENTKKAFGFFPSYEPIIPESLEIVKKTMGLYPEKFVPFLMTPENDNSPSGFPTVDNNNLEKMLAIYPGLFKGYGEIGLYARDGGAPALPPDSKRLLDIYPLIKKNKLVVYFHLGYGQKENFEKVLAQNRDINFIWHGDQLITRKNDRQNLQEVDDILSNHPNAYYGVDELYGDVWLLKPGVKKEKFLAHFKNYEPLLAIDLENWKNFIEKHPNQVMWGSDRGVDNTWSTDPDVGATLTGYIRAFIGRLDPAVQENFAYKNAEKLFE